MLEAVTGGEAHVTPHLNDFFYLAHWHDPDDGFVNLESQDMGADDDTASMISVVKRGNHENTSPTGALISEAVRRAPQTAAIMPLISCLGYQPARTT